MSQAPVDPEKYERMKKFLSRASTKEELKSMTMLYILDQSYPRADIALALHDIEIEKGWH